MINASDVPSFSCGEQCPLIDMPNGAEARQWVFSDVQPHEEGERDSRFPNVGMTAMDKAVRCKFLNVNGTCPAPPPEV